MTKRMDSFSQGFKSPYPEHLMKALRSMSSVDEKDTKKDKEICSNSPNELFDMLLKYEGIIGYSTTIKGFVKEIYGIDLDQVSSDLLSESLNNSQGESKVGFKTREVKLAYFHRDSPKEACLSDTLNFAMVEIENPHFYENGNGGVICIDQDETVGAFDIFGYIEDCEGHIEDLLRKYPEGSFSPYTVELGRHSDISTLIVEREDGYVSFYFETSDRPGCGFKVLRYMPAAGVL